MTLGVAVKSISRPSLSNAKSLVVTGTVQMSEDPFIFDGCTSILKHLPSVPKEVQLGADEESTPLVQNSFKRMMPCHASLELQTAGDHPLNHFI